MKLVAIGKLSAAATSTSTNRIQMWRLACLLIPSAYPQPGAHLVEIPKHPFPVRQTADRDHPQPNFLSPGVVGGEADSELAHHFAGRILAVFEAAGDGERELEVLVQGFALLGDGRGGRGISREELAGLAEDPGVADAAA